MSESVYILGVSAFYHDSAAALVKDGEIIGAVHEERFTRIKGDSSFPINAIKYLLKEADIDPSLLTAAIFYESPQQKLDRLLSTQLTGRFNTIKIFNRSMRAYLPEKLWVANQFKKHLKRKIQILFSDHHLSHAASAYYPSPFESAAILTVDGVGEWSTTTIGKGAGSNIELIKHIEFPDSLGLLYSAFTHYTGFKINSGEYKLMGLAPYGEAKYVDLIKKNLITLHPDGSFSLNPKYFSYLHSENTYNRDFEGLFSHPTRNKGDKLSKFHADIAASIQEVTNEAMLNLAKTAKELTGEKNLVLAGGVALNVVAIGMIEKSKLFDQIWVQPAAGDAGGSLGAALLATYQEFGSSRKISKPDSMKGSLLGPTPDFEESAEDALLEYGLIFEYLDDELLAEKVANLLSEGKIVALARGRMEFGPRALGARSILAPATDPLMQERLNVATKHRENFRPFAPIVTEEMADKYFELDGHTSPYMLKTYQVRNELRFLVNSDNEDIFAKRLEIRSQIPAVTHVDYSARVQTVSHQTHPFMHRVLSNYHALTNMGVLVNTSFNLRGEPIVNNVKEAIECFLFADIDALVINNFLIVKSLQNKKISPKRPPALKED